MEEGNENEGFVYMWKKGMKMKGLRLNSGKTKVMQCLVNSVQSVDSREHPCGVCRKE